MPPRNLNINLSDADLYSYYSEAKRAGKKRKEIAAALGIEDNTLRWRLYQIKKGLKAGKQPDSTPPEEFSPPPESIRISQDNNYLEVEASRTRIISLDDLLAAANVDLSVWQVERYTVNKWEVGAKTARRKIEWKDGQIVEGFLDDPGRLEVEPLFQVKIYLIRKKPVAVTPAISPIQISVEKIPARPERSRIRDTKFKRAVILPDIQAGFSRDLFTSRIEPFHDRRALDISLQIVERIAPDRIVFLGDLLDLPDWTDKFIRSPEFYFNTQSAVVEFSWWLSQFRAAAPDAEIDALEGNHDLRMRTALQAHLNAAYQIRPANELKLPPALSVERLLAFQDLGIRYVEGYPNNEVWLSDHIRIIHGSTVRATPGDTAKIVAADSDVTTIFGHIHRIERAARTTVKRDGTRTITAASPGTLCRTDQAVPGNVKGQDWQQGLAVVTYSEDPQDDFTSIEIIEILSGRAIYSGEIYAARDHLERIRSDTLWDF